MGWGHGAINGKEVGYNVKATCEHPGCNKKIDRGLAYACGNNHGAGDIYCDGYFCSEHLIFGAEVQLCPSCYTAWEQSPAGVEAEHRHQDMIAERMLCGHDEK